MDYDERRILESLSTVAELETWLRCARAELRSDPGDPLLCRFIELVELKLREPRCLCALLRTPTETLEPSAAGKKRAGALNSS